MLAVDDDTVASADKYKVAKMSDLGAASKDLVLGGPPECLQRLFCLFGLQQTYGTQFKAFKPLDARWAAHRRGARRR